MKGWVRSERELNKKESLKEIGERRLLFSQTDKKIIGRDVKCMYL